MDKATYEKLFDVRGRVAIVTGGTRGIGRAIAEGFVCVGANVVVASRKEDACRDAEARLHELGAASQGDALAVPAHMGDLDAAAALVERTVERFGGVDIVVSNAGAAWQGRIGEVDDMSLRASFELNFFSHQYAAQAAVRIMRRQGTGGSLLFNISKQAVNPGPDFGPYGIPKAATLALMRQYAVDYGAEGITANAVNADRIRSGLLTEDFAKRRAKARHVSLHDYMAGNLLKREVRAEDVAEAFVSLALARKTTGAVLTVDGGNIAAAMR